MTSLTPTLTLPRQGGGGNWDQDPSSTSSPLEGEDKGGGKLLSRRARMIVHDLRNPLSVIRGYLQVASREVSPKSSPLPHPTSPYKGEEKKAGPRKVSPGPRPHPTSPYKGEEKKVGLILGGGPSPSLPLLCKEGRGEVESGDKLDIPDDAGALRSYLDGALAATTELDEMIQSMLDLAVVEEGSFEPKRMPVDVADLLKRIEKRLGPWIRQEARDLTIESPTEPVEMFADPVFVERAVKNLVMHAVRRSPVGTKIVLGCERVPPHPNLPPPGGKGPEKTPSPLTGEGAAPGGLTVPGAPGMAAEGEGGGVVFYAVDQGPLIPAALAAVYFDTSQQNEHRELGWKADRAFALACVKKVAEGHGGSVGIESGPEGTRFFFSLPAGGGKNGNACE